MSTEPYYLGVDGGGSKTLAVIVDAQGRECGRGRAASANYTTVGLEQTVQNIHAAIQQAAHDVPCSLPFAKAWLGLAGVDRPSDIALLHAHVRDLALFVSVTNDAELLLSAFGERAGIVLIVGTGSIALARDATGHVSRTGGWGYLLGDEGSGYDIGRRGLQAAVRAADGRGKATSLLPLLLRHWQLQTAKDFIDVVYRVENRANIASVAPCVTQAAYRGDEVAREIVEQAASELALLVRTLAPVESRLPLALGGGLLLHDAFLRERVLQHIQREREIGPVIPVDQPAYSAACAARTLYSGEDKR